MNTNMTEGNLGFLRQKLSGLQFRNKKRYDLYDMEYHTQALPVFDDTRFMTLTQSLGWCSKAVDALADRLCLSGWKNDNFRIDEIFQMNNPDILFDSAIVSALITGCAFVYISKDPDQAQPRLEVIDGRYATGIMDPVTNLLTEGYAILDFDVYGNPTTEAHFLPGKTVFYIKGQEPSEVQTNCDHPLLIPIVYKPDAKKPYGHSRITRSMMDLIACANRTVLRSEVCGEYYSYPQKYLLGTAYELTNFDKIEATATSFLNISKDSDGDKPTAGQFNTQTMQPFVDQIRLLASLFAGEAGLTLDDLGFVSDNPSSAEAIKASHETLRLTAKKAQRSFGTCFLNVGFVAACVRDGFPYQRSQFYLTQPVWEPIFEPDSAMLSSIGDGAIKVNQAVPGFFNKDNLEELTGMEASSLPAPVTEG